MLLALNIAASPADKESRDAAMTRDAATRNIGYARLRINRDVRFVVDDDSATLKIEPLQRAGKPDNAHGLPRFLDREPGRMLIPFEHLIKPAG